ncbi:RodZ family helix-turn-helix domain-containing protein [Polynucleobacter sp. MWH-Svant-W18]|uniref:helix-turn-helix domain-containing protein n=1 Tax=Polynucleobacter sp. MWH-Svant-W18 TaxID=1855909 RepID=UPI001BFD10E9|nr:helix-turn-helix domain-containing protein [Polynucleobacter sp. MWH-Svant-W18]QWD77438.1 helix-turn-helix domain-containing protein [Polynucleobacter sp. MWH-Svant-W18]
MNKTAKLPEIRKEVFTTARESLGLTMKDLSGMACLSVRQIEQIENGQITSFYSPQVKVTAAKKVANLLKLAESEAFDFGNSAPARERAAEEVISAPEIQPESEKVIAVNAPKPAVSIGANEKNSYHYSKKKPLIAMAIVVAVGVFAAVNLRPVFFPEPPKEELVIVEEVVQDAPVVNTPVEEEKSAATIPAPAPSSATQSLAPATALVSIDCPSADSAAISYTPDSPRKPGDMVYVQAKTAQNVCVIDATGKTQSKALEAGVGVSVYGKPPFKVLTQGLNQVDIYFQGFKVRTANSAGRTIILEPAELSQLVVPAESQTR